MTRVTCVVYLRLDCQCDVSQQGHIGQHKLIYVRKRSVILVWRIPHILSSSTRWQYDTLLSIQYTQLHGSHPRLLKSSFKCVRLYYVACHADKYMYLSSVHCTSVCYACEYKQYVDCWPFWFTNTLPIEQTLPVYLTIHFSHFALFGGKFPPKCAWIKPHCHWTTPLTVTLWM